jgi:hypothetical protein
LKAGEDDGLRHLSWVHPVGAANHLFGATVAEAKLGFYSAGEDSSNLNAVLAKFSVEGLGEAYLGEFADTVDGLAGCSPQAGHRGDKEDGSALLGDHVRDGVAGEEEAGLYVGVHEGVVVFGGDVDEVLVVPYSGVVDEDVQGSEGLDREGYNFLRGRFFRGVPGVKDGLGSKDSISVQSWRRRPSRRAVTIRFAPIPALAPVTRAVFPVRFMTCNVKIRSFWMVASDYADG